MNKYQDMTFRSIKEAREYIADIKSRYGFEPQIIKLLEATRDLPKGLIIEYRDVTWDDKKDYVLAPLYGFGGWCIVSRSKAKEITL